MATADKEAVTLEPWAIGVGLATLLLVTGVALFTAWDRAHTSQLEAVIMPTAVGDIHFISVPPAHKGPTGLKYQGKKLDMLSEAKIRDATLLRAGIDDSGVYSLYRPEDQSNPLDKDHYYMKAKANDFIEVSPE